MFSWFDLRQKQENGRWVIAPKSNFKWKYTNKTQKNTFTFHLIQMHQLLIFLVLFNFILSLALRSGTISFDLI